jgi:hypothetical protein
MRGALETVVLKQQDVVVAAAVVDWGPAVEVHAC